MEQFEKLANRYLEQLAKDLDEAELERLETELEVLLPEDDAELTPFDEVVERVWDQHKDNFTAVPEWLEREEEEDEGKVLKRRPRRDWCCACTDGTRKTFKRIRPARARFRCTMRCWFGHGAQGGTLSPGRC